MNEVKSGDKIYMCIEGVFMARIAGKVYPEWFTASSRVKQKYTDYRVTWWSDKETMREDFLKKIEEL